jgi:hypothetical protein
MDPVTIALIGGNMVGGLLSAQQQRKQRDYEMRVKAAEVEAQPFMKRDVQKTQVTTPVQSPWQGLLKGGYGAAGQIQAFQKAGLMSPSASSGTEAPQKFDAELDQLTPEEKEAAMEEAMSVASKKPSMMWSQLSRPRA